jgi:hypothetical protein
VPVVELGTGPTTFELLPTFWPFQPVLLTFSLVLPVSQPSTTAQERSSKRTDALNMVSPWERFYLEIGWERNAGKSGQNRPCACGANIQTLKQQGKTGLARLFLHLSNN